ncbi:SDR family oxidoreductase [Owenweeksia hongkongensis]|uniref:SDR family oxidoreductase n=1 Tax=Owenweeksia hongkongensis TaxID=253245 RepID=UPI003A8CD53E
MRNWVLILGGSSGIGLATAKKMAAEGFNLCIVYRARKADEAIAEKEFHAIKELGVECLTFNKDALKVEVVAKIVSKLKERGVSIKLLLHSIAKGNLKLMAPILNSDMLPAGLQGAFRGESNFLKEDDFLLTAQAMAVSYYNWAKALLDNGCFDAQASCVALTSEGGKKAWRNYAAVSSAKAMLEAISRNMALELAPYGIRSNILQPGITDTPSLRMIPGSSYLVNQAIQRSPFGRLTLPEDVANVVYMLSLKEAQWINGTIIPVDGGESIS